MHLKFKPSDFKQSHLLFVNCNSLPFFSTALHRTRTEPRLVAPVPYRIIFYCRTWRKPGMCWHDNEVDIPIKVTPPHFVSIWSTYFQLNKEIWDCLANGAKLSDVNYEADPEFVSFLEMLRDDSWLPKKSGEFIGSYTKVNRGDVNF